MKLYVLQGACPLVPHTALAMVKASYSAEYEIVNMSHDALKSPEFLALNPKGSTPVLTDGDFALPQNLAILTYINAKFPNAHIFGKGDEKHLAKTMQWLSFVNADLHPAFTPLFNPAVVLADESQADAIRTQAVSRILGLYKLAEDQLNGKDFLNGEFTVADMYLYVTLRWATKMGIDFSQYANLVNFIKTVEQNPFVLQALKEQDLEVL